MSRVPLAALALLPAAVACSGPSERVMPSHLVEGTPMYDVLPKDGIPAIDEPEFVSAEEAAAFMHPDEPVIGVVSEDGQPRCYSAWQLDEHEIVNDTLDGKPIAVTW